MNNKFNKISCESPPGQQNYSGVCSLRDRPGVSARSVHCDHRSYQGAGARADESFGDSK